MIGLSLSFCVKDIISGEVSIFDVEKIIAGTMIDSPESLARVINSYAENYWYDNPAVAKWLVRQLFESGRIEQPRCEGKMPHSIHSGYWVKDQQEADQRLASDSW